MTTKIKKISFYQLRTNKKNTTPIKRHPRSSTPFFRKWEVDKMTTQKPKDSFFAPSIIQTKPSIVQPKDFNEQEADKMADSLIRKSQNGSPFIIDNTHGKSNEKKTIAIQTKSKNKILKKRNPETNRVSGRTSHSLQFPSTFSPVVGDETSIDVEHSKEPSGEMIKRDNLRSFPNELTPEVLQKRADSIIQRSPASDMINDHTSWANLDEERLGRSLYNRAVRGEYSFVTQVLDELGMYDRDDVSLGFMQAANDRAIYRLSGGAAGRRLLDRLFDELTSGDVGADETAEADRILRIKAQRIPESEFPQDGRGVKIFPFHSGWAENTVYTVTRQGNGQIHVEMGALSWSSHHRQLRNIPSRIATSGITLEENEIIGVKLIDEGGEIVYRPALIMVQLQNQLDFDTLNNIITTVGIGLTLGSGALVGGAARGGTWLARAAIWGERAAFAIDIITNIIRENRGWIIRNFGSNGRRFLYFNDLIASAAAIYGLVDVAVNMGRLVNNFRRAFVNWRSAARASSLSPSETQIINRISNSGDELLENADQISASRNQPDTQGTPDSPSSSSQGEARPSEPAPGPARDQPEVPPSRRGTGHRIEVPESISGVCRIGSLNCTSLPQSVVDDVVDYPNPSQVPMPDGPFSLRGLQDAGYRALRRVTGRSLRRIYLRNPSQWSQDFRQAFTSQASRSALQALEDGVQSGVGNIDELVRNAEAYWPRTNGRRWEVHHRKPLDFGGDNSPENLFALSGTDHAGYTGWWNSVKSRFRRMFDRADWDSLITGDSDASLVE